MRKNENDQIKKSQAFLFFLEDQGKAESASTEEGHDGVSGALWEGKERFALVDNLVKGVSDDDLRSQRQSGEER